MTDPKEYGRALFLLSEEEGISDTLIEDVRTVGAVFSENPEYSKLLNTPALSKEERLSLIDESLLGVHRHLKSLIKMLAEAHSAHTAKEALSGFISAYEAARGIERATVISAVPLTDVELIRLREKLEAATGRTFIIDAQCDPAILGGMKLRYMGKQLDSSLKTKLDRFAASLAKTVV